MFKQTRSLLTSVLVTILLATGIVVPASAQDVTEPEQLPQECLDLINKTEKHHELTEILKDALSMAVDGQAEVYAKTSSSTMIVAVQIARCGNKWLFVRLHTGYPQWGLKWKGRFYGLVTHFFPSGERGYIMREVRYYDLNLLQGVSTLVKILNRLFLVIVVFTCPPGEYHSWCLPGLGEPTQ